MVRTLLQQLASAVGEGNVRLFCAAVPLLLVAFLVWSSRAGRRRIAELEVAPGRWGLLPLWAAGGLRLLLGAGAVGLLCLLLSGEAALFLESHGRVTERNASAVRSKWGVPHEQRDLRVEHCLWEMLTEEEFAGGGGRTVRAPGREPAEGEAEEEILGDELFEPARDREGRLLDPRAVVRRTKKRVRVTPPAESILVAEVEIDLRNSPRTLGGASYPGFEDACVFAYTVTNPLAEETAARFSFPLPAGGQGLFNRLSVRFDGESVAGLRYADGAVCWTRRLPPGARGRVEIAYESRGLEYFRYWPGNLRERCTVALRLRGVPPERLNFPIGSMSPVDRLSALKGEDYTLHWDLSRAVTHFSVGVIVPSPRQPGFEVARLLTAAPGGLVPLAFLLLLTRFLLGAPAQLLPWSLSLAAHALAYTAFAGISDHCSTFAIAFAAGAVLPALAGAVFWWRRDGGWLGAQSALLHLLFTLGYPLAVHAERYTDAVLGLAWAGLAAYVLSLAAVRGRREWSPEPAA